MPLEPEDESLELIPDEPEPDDLLLLVITCVVMITVTRVVSEPMDELVRVSVVKDPEPAESDVTLSVAVAEDGELMEAELEVNVEADSDSEEQITVVLEEDGESCVD